MAFGEDLDGLVTPIIGSPAILEAKQPVNHISVNKIDKGDA